MNSNSCICDSPVLGQIASTASGAVHHYIVAIIGKLLFIRMQEKRVLPFTQMVVSAISPSLHCLPKESHAFKYEICPGMEFGWLCSM